MEKTVSITKTTNGKLHSLPFEDIKNTIIGKKYTLSLVFAGDIRMSKLNKQYRNKDYIPNVLSFPLSKSTGEIFINPNRVKKEAKQYGLSEKGYTAFLLIHGLLHLKGERHGATMKSKEQKVLQMFGIK